MNWKNNIYLAETNKNSQPDNLRPCPQSDNRELQYKF